MCAVGSPPGNVPAYRWPGRDVSDVIFRQLTYDDLGCASCLIGDELAHNDLLAEDDEETFVVRAIGSLAP